MFFDVPTCLMRYFRRGLFTGGLLLLFYTVAIYQAAGKGQKIFLDLFKSFFLIVFNLHLELPSDHQENRNASQLSGCGSLGMEYIRHRFDT